MIAPAFDSRKQAIGFCLLLLGLLLLPVITGALGVLSRADLYTAMPAESGAFSYMHQQIFEEKSDLDMVILGSSIPWVGVDTAYVQKQLSAQLGREARVITLGSKFPGEDRTCLVLRDLLQHRKVRMLVLNMSGAEHMYNEPHPQAYRFFRIEDDAKLTSHLPVRYQIPLYASACLGMPRNLLNEVRPNPVEPPPFASDLGTYKVKAGYAGIGSKFEAFFPPPPKFSTQTLIYSPASATNFSFSTTQLNEYQSHFVEQMGRLVREHNVQLVLLNIPRRWVDRRSAQVQEMTYWPDVFRTPLTMVGAAPARLFAGLSDDDLKKLYYSDHFNENGNFFFTRVVTPALVELYAQNANR